MIEEFIHGLQLSTESFLLNGKCFTAAFCERNYSRIDEFRPYIIEDGGTIPAVLTEPLKESINDLILNGARALGISEGIVKGDIVINENGTPMIIELAARLSGGWFATHQIPEATGVSLVDAVMSLCMNEPIDEADLIPTKNKSTSIRYWFPEAGLVQGIHGEDQLKKIPSLISYGFFRNVGDIQPVVKMHSDRFGYVIVGGHTREKSLRNVELAISSIKIKIQSGK